MSYELKCDLVKCIKSYGDFEEGDIYAIVGWNNGYHLIKERKDGEIQEYILHNTGDTNFSNDDVLKFAEDFEHSPVFQFVALKDTNVIAPTVNGDLQNYLYCKCDSDMVIINRVNKSNLGL